MISLYTKEVGKHVLIARGVKKSVSKNTAHLEPFSLVSCDMAKGKEYDYLTHIQSVSYFPGIREDLWKSLAAGCMVGITDRLLHEKQSDVGVYQLLISWLLFLEKTAHPSPLVLDAYMLRLFAALGFRPTLAVCVVCKKEYRDMMIETMGKDKTTMRITGFSFVGGGIVCADCRDVKERAGEAVISFGLKEVSDIEIFLSANWIEVDLHRCDATEAAFIHRLVYDFACFHSEKEIPDWGGLRGLVE